MNKYIDVKITTWQRLHFNDDANMQDLIQKLKENTFPFDLCYESEFEELEYLSEADEYLYPNENNNQPTVEVYEGNEFQECIWTNQIYENN
jgi:hypothetical protein